MRSATVLGCKDTEACALARPLMWQSGAGQAGISFRLRPVEQDSAERRVELLAYLATHADECGWVDRDALRDLYAEKYAYAGTGRNSSANAPISGTRKVGPETMLRTFKDTRYRSKNTRHGRQSSEWLKRDLQDLERWGVVARDLDRVQVRDWIIVNGFLDGSLETGRDGLPQLRQLPEA